MSQNSENQRKNDTTIKNSNGNHDGKHKGKNNINNEHDKIFRTILTNKDEAANLINKAVIVKKN